ncbi:copper chaperone PCu(A)C [Oceanisphaera pacifica]|uniref:Copper chaperone PCu(A)C n=1 Tax=Oceanisphaera pacifica TaxID=2818389 RepID=A0ABS3NIE7_9GAMM|nr:copper chaperone PCu(A)C [Oceanisphaera pacifica]MBO1520097.1 copper chaperone PCu(A)C [Oceanisphaera pacifica]
MTALKVLLTSALLLGTAAVSAHDYHAADLDIAHPWARPLPPVATVGVTYFTVSNQSDTDDVLLSAESPVSETVEIHTHVKEGDMMKMRKLDELAIPAHKEVILAPGGHHLMLMNLKEVPTEGERFPVTLHFKEAGSVEVEVAVETPSASRQHNAAEHSHH